MPAQRRCTRGVECGTRAFTQRDDRARQFRRRIRNRAAGSARVSTRPGARARVLGRCARRRRRCACERAVCRRAPRTRRRDARGERPVARLRASQRCRLDRQPFFPETAVEGDRRIRRVPCLPRLGLRAGGDARDAYRVRRRAAVRVSAARWQYVRFARASAGGTPAGRLESEILLSRFFARLDEHPGLDAAARERLRDFARAHGLAGYV